MSKPRVVIAVDTFGWAFHSIAKQIERHNKQQGAKAKSKSAAAE